MIGRKPSEYVALDLPIPVSTNALWRSIVVNGHVRVVKSKAYQAWLAEAGYCLNAQKPGMVSSVFGLRMRVANDCRADLDNMLKATLDLLQIHGIILDDKLAQRITIERAPIKGMSLLVISCAMSVAREMEEKALEVAE